MNDLEDGNGVVAWAIPTIQIPTTFVSGSVGVPSNVEVSQNLLSSALGSGGVSNLLADIDPDQVRADGE